MKKKYSKSKSASARSSTKSKPLNAGLMAYMAAKRAKQHGKPLPSSATKHSKPSSKKSSGSKQAQREIHASKKSAGSGPAKKKINVSTQSTNSTTTRHLY